MGATKIMIIRHGEKPGKYNGTRYFGVNNIGTVASDDGTKHLVTLGWERAGALVTLFAPPWGPKPPLETPNFLFASDPAVKHDDDSGDEGPSQRPYETLTALAERLKPTKIDTTYRKKHYANMVTAALACDGVVLISWQHEDIALTTKAGEPGISREILTQSGAASTFGVPTSWPTDPAGASRYDLVFVFDRPSGSGPITGFTLVPQRLLAGDI